MKKNNIHDKIRKKLVQHSLVFVIGGILYYLIELLWRGRSNWTMMLVGGFCFVLIGLVNEVFPANMPLPVQMMIGALLVTVTELAAGLILNRWLGMGIWDYSMLPYNLWGQISLHYTWLWWMLSLPAIILEDWLHHWFFGEEKPHYVLL